MIYVTVVTVLLVIIFIMMPKHMKTKDIVIMWLMISYVELVADLYLAQVLELYHFAGEKSVSPDALTIKLFIGPLFGIIFVNFMPKGFLAFIPYWIVWVVFSTFFEWTTSVFGYLQYTGWNLYLSLPFYVISIPITRKFYFYIKH